MAKGGPMLSDDDGKDKDNTGERLYIPSVYRYSCQGIFFVSRNSPAERDDGVCYGIQSDMQHIQNLSVSTRQDAIETFAAAQAVQDGNEALRSLQRSSTNRHLTVVPTTENKEQEQQEKEQQQGNVSEEHLYIANGKNVCLDDRRVVQKAWSSYGSTVVECLRLKDIEGRGEVEFVAVRPYKPGRVSFFHFGSLHERIMLFRWMLDRHSNNHHSHEHEHDHYLILAGQVSKICLQNDTTNPAAERASSSNSSGGGSAAAATDATSPTAPFPSSREVHFLMTNENPWMSTFLFRRNPSHACNVSKLDPQKILVDGQKAVVAATTCYVNFCHKMISKMTANGTFLGWNLTHDMVGRSWKSGQRVTKHIPRFTALLTKSMCRMFYIPPNNDDKRDHDKREPK